MKRYVAVQEMFLSYFHPDWRVDASSRFEVAMDFLETTDPLEVRSAIAELGELLRESISDDELYEMVLNDYSLFYDPARDNVTMRDWLRGLRHELENGQASPIGAPHPANARAAER